MIQFLSFFSINERTQIQFLNAIYLRWLDIGISLANTIHQFTSFSVIVEYWKYIQTHFICFLSVIPFTFRFLPPILFWLHLLNYLMEIECNKCSIFGKRTSLVAIRYTAASCCQIIFLFSHKTSCSSSIWCCCGHAVNMNNYINSWHSIHSNSFTQYVVFHMPRCEGGTETFARWEAGDAHKYFICTQNSTNLF